MSQDVFCSLYTKDFKWWEKVERPSSARGINIAEDPEKYEKFLSPEELKPGKECKESPDAIKALRSLWWKTTYRVDFCEDRPSGGDSFQQEDEKDELMDSMERLFHPAERRLLPPPDTTRVVFGFCPARRFRAARSLYADVHSRPAYERLKRFVGDRGACAGCRLTAPAARYPEPDYSTPPCRQGRPLPVPTWIHLRPEPDSRGPSP